MSANLYEKVLTLDMYRAHRSNETVGHILHQAVNDLALYDVDCTYQGRLKVTSILDDQPSRGLGSVIQ